LTEPERAAIRAFLQRAEVRISTMHRIATAFISGAGLLILVPIFFKDVIDNIIRVLIDYVETQSDYGDLDGWLILVLICISYGLILSLCVPLYALLVLFKDMVQFYFTVYTPGYPADLLHPTFSLNALAFSPDEGPGAKTEIMRAQYHNPASIPFIMPFSSKRRALYFDDLLTRTNDKILPPSRSVTELASQGILPPQHDPDLIRHLNTAFGIARLNDRNLLDEVAQTEMLMARNIIYLRRLVLRYVKALLMFVWTALVSFMVLPLAQEENWPLLELLSVGYLFWSIGVLPIMSLPVHWIYRHRQEIEPHPVDHQLVHLERRVRPFVWIGVGLSILGVVLSIGVV
jgi:hypothetical protein